MSSNQIGSVCCEEQSVPEEFRGGNWSDFASSQNVSDSVAHSGAYYDDISGAALPTELVEDAIKEEMAEYNKHQVYTKVPIQECWDVTGRKPIGIRWVIVNKGDDISPNVRARLVGKEFKTDNRMDLFAATPPL